MTSLIATNLRTSRNKLSLNRKLDAIQRLSNMTYLLKLKATRTVDGRTLETVRDSLTYTTYICRFNYIPTSKENNRQSPTTALTPDYTLQPNSTHSSRQLPTLPTLQTTPDKTRPTSPRTRPCQSLTTPLCPQGLEEFLCARQVILALPKDSMDHLQWSELK